MPEAITDHGFTPWPTAPTRCNTCGKVVGRHVSVLVKPEDAPPYEGKRKAKPAAEAAPAATDSTTTAPARGKRSKALPAPDPAIDAVLLSPTPGGKARRQTIDESVAWQEWAMRLADAAPKGATVGWLGDFKYAIILGSGPCGVVVKVSAYDKEQAQYTVEDCPHQRNGEYPTLEAAITAASGK